MADGTKIEWTDATWNPVTGCSVVSPGCTNCYAMRLAGSRMRHHPSRQGLTTPGKAGPVWNGVVRFNEQWLGEPLRWKRPRRIFVCAHGDLFHEAVTDYMIDQVFAVMARAPQHQFQVLTKRAQRMHDYLHALPDRISDWSAHSALDWVDLPLPNVWLGVSVEDQARADERIPLLLKTPAAVRWLSCEPLLGPIDPLFRIIKAQSGGQTTAALVQQAHPSIDWVVAGGESGPNARPMHPDWVRSLRDNCGFVGVPFLFKQWGAWKPLDANDGQWPTDGSGCIRLTGQGDRTPQGWPLQNVGKRHAGRQLDGVQHDRFPS